MQPTRCRLGRCGESVADHIEVVAGDAPEDARKSAADFVLMFSHQFGGPGIERGLEGASPRPPLPLRTANGLKRGWPAIGQYHVEREHMVDGLAIDDRACSGRVVADHAAKVGPTGSGDVGPKLQAERVGGAVELVEDDARLNADPASLAVDRFDVVEILADIHDKARTDRLPRETGAAAAWGDGYSHLPSNLHGDPGFLNRARQKHTERFDLVDAGI